MDFIDYSKFHSTPAPEGYFYGPTGRLIRFGDPVKLAQLEAKLEEIRNRDPNRHCVDADQFVY